MHIVTIPNLLRKIIYKNAIWDIHTNEKNIFLTFDDGPNPQTTPYILEILKQYNAKATFFCVGENIQKYPKEFKLITDSDHSIGNHTYNHLNGWKTETIKYIENINKFDSIFQSNLFRPPYGRIKNSQILALKNKYQLILWNVLSGDYDKNISSNACLTNVLKYTKEGSIVVFHDSLKAIEKVKIVLPQFLNFFHEKGYKFEALSENALSRKLTNDFSI